MIIHNFTPFRGQHCETTATGCLLNQIGIELSEPMLFGLGQGLGFIYWNMQQMDMPFLGGRIKPDAITTNLANHLNLTLEIKETSSVKKAWENLKEKVDSNLAVGIKLDCYHLDYFTRKFHFAAHYVGMYGYDETYAYLVDTIQQGTAVRATLENLALARNEKGPMASKNLMYSLSKKEGGYDIGKAIVTAIKANAKDFLNPAITNFGYKGIYKTSREIKNWFKSTQNIKNDFTLTAMLMEKAGTGGALFRNLYRDFLRESYELLNIEILGEAGNRFTEIAKLWRKVSSSLNKAGETEDFAYINQASDILVDLSDKERQAMELLENII